MLTAPWLKLFAGICGNWTAAKYPKKARAIVNGMPNWPPNI